MLRLILIVVSILLQSAIAFASGDRVALVIGNARYESLGTLANTVNDAKGIERALKDMGYKTRLVVDASDTTIRKELKKFANESEGASVAVIFYAGHGAQVNGENYLLPVDMDAPQRESDIQLSGIKIDDMVNSLKSNTKIVFLDACRDNPALMKSMTKGRGTYRGGLAPASSSTLDSNNGIFIAYATDAGNVASDGEGLKNSPFTSALLKYIKEPISIDDMFSKVTKEVRTSTHNQQKPYKYASLDSVVCIPGTCGAADFSSQQQSLSSKQLTSPSKTENISPSPPTATNVSTNNLPADDTWVIFESRVEDASLVYINPRQVKSLGDRTVFNLKWQLINAPPQGVSIPRGAYQVDSHVVDCRSSMISISESVIYSKTGEIVYQYKFGDPKLVALQPGFKDNTIGGVATKLVCNLKKALPTLTKGEITSGDWELLYTQDPSIGKSLSYSKKSLVRSNGHGLLTTRIGANTPMQFDVAYPGFSKSKDLPAISYLIFENDFDCEKRKNLITRHAAYDKDGTMIYVGTLPLYENTPIDLTDDPGVQQLFSLTCNK